MSSKEIPKNWISPARPLGRWSRGKETRGVVKMMNKYKVAETIVSQILADLRKRIESGANWDVADTETNQEIQDKWEDIIIAELEKGLAS